MESIIEYIVMHYIWFLGGGIVILLAIIGYFTDKTNFGQVKNNEKETKKDSRLKEIQENDEFTLQDAVDKIQEKEFQKEESIQEKQEKVETHQTAYDKINNKLEEKVEEKDFKEEVKVDTEYKKQTDFEDAFEKFDKEFDEILPKKEIIEDEFLDDIENLKLDKTQKLDLNDIPDLDDVDLPKILESEDENVWKF